MIVSFVVRLVVDEFPADALVGEVHNVATGEQSVVRNLGDLLDAFERGARNVRSELDATQEGT